MAWRKSPQGFVDLFEQAVPPSRAVERRRMFGYPPARERAKREHGARPFEPMPGRQMREYVALPEALLRDPA
jgi:hypothetical protein